MSREKMFASKAIHTVFFVVLFMLFFFINVSSAANIQIVKNALSEINFGDILEVNISIKNLESSEISVSVKEYVTNADPIQPENLIYSTPPEGMIAAEPPFYSWNVTLSPLSTYTITYKIKPLSFGDFFISPTEVRTSTGEVFYSNSLVVLVRPISNGVCEPENGENYYTNPKDCPSGSADDICDLIEDGRCDPDCEPGADPDCATTILVCNNNGICEEGENHENCPQDCPKPAVCGNGICEEDETQENCCKDCGCPEGEKCFKDRCIPDLCGNGYCEPKFDENYNNCKEDCPSGSKDKYCDGLADGICDPDCSKEEDIDCVKPGNIFLIYLVIFLVVIGLIILIAIKSRRE